MKPWRILDMTTGRELAIVEAKTERGAKIIYRRDNPLQYNYQWIVACRVINTWYESTNPPTPI